jgi:hypothetical protein
MDYDILCFWIDSVCVPFLSYHDSYSRLEVSFIFLYELYRKKGKQEVYLT